MSKNNYKELIEKTSSKYLDTLIEDNIKIRMGKQYAEIIFLNMIGTGN